jgi:hypothetical protein
LAPVLNAVANAQAPGAPLYAAMDDTLLRKRGRKVHGAGHWRDPLGPKFRTNLVWAQRFMQISLMLPQDCASPMGAARAIPVQLSHAPVPRRPHPKADAATVEAYRQHKHASRISALGAEQLHGLRRRMDQNAAAASRVLITSVDGGLTNRTLWRNIPPRTILVGRVRKDAKLFAPPEAQAQRGRKRLYGQPLPTPEDLGVEFATYLNGLAEVTGELRRRCLDLLRQGYWLETERLLGCMDDIYGVLVTLDYPDAITNGLRRQTDLVRGIVERTRGDLTISLREQHLQQALAALSGRLDSLAENDADDPGL